MTLEHMLRTLGRVKGFVVLVAASVQLVLLGSLLRWREPLLLRTPIASSNKDNQIPQITVQPRTRSKGSK